MKIDVKARNLCIAMSLGDGTINSNGYLAMRHCLVQKEYIEWKQKQLNSVGIRTTDCYYVDNGGYGSYELRTYNHNFLKLYRKIIYKPQKTVSRKLLDKLDAKGIAIWYMDDGSISWRKNKQGVPKSNILTICTCTTKEQNQIIIDYFSEVWNVRFGQRKMGNQFALVCSTGEARKFIDIVSPTVSEVECMKYKLNVKR